MKYPATINIAGHRIKLKFVPLADCYGQYDHEIKTIQINSAFKSDRECVLVTIRHEMMEASLLLSGVGFSDKYEQEIIVRCMEEIFFPAWDKFIATLNKIICQNSKK
jgi:hypothetical protein